MSKKVWLLEIGLNILLPWLIYKQLFDHGMAETPALLWSAVPPIVWSVVELLWHRRLDAVATISLLGLVLSALMLGMGGSPRWVLARESLVTGVLGLAALLSLALKKPAMFYLARATLAREGAEAAARFDQRLNDPQTRQAMNIMTIVWGGGMVAECVLRVVLAFTWPIERFLLVSPFMFYGVMGLLAGWTVWYRRRLRVRFAGR